MPTYPLRCDALDCPDPATHITPRGANGELLPWLSCDYHFTDSDARPRRRPQLLYAASTNGVAVGLEETHNLVLDVAQHRVTITDVRDFIQALELMVRMRTTLDVTLHGTPFPLPGPFPLFHIEATNQGDTTP